MNTLENKKLAWLGTNLFMVLLMVFIVHLYGQNHSISMEVQLDDDKGILQIQQRIVFFNNSDSILTEIFLHYWANSYKNKKSPLARRLIEDFDKTLYFAREKDRGYTDIQKLSENSTKRRLFTNWAMRGDPLMTSMWTHKDIKDGKVKKLNSNESLKLFEKFSREIDQFN